MQQSCALDCKRESECYTFKFKDSTCALGGVVDEDGFGLTGDEEFFIYMGIKIKAHPFFKHTFTFTFKVIVNENTKQIKATRQQSNCGYFLNCISLYFYSQNIQNYFGGKSCLK